jgi:hypothetical protein
MTLGLRADNAFDDALFRVVKLNNTTEKWVGFYGSKPDTPCPGYDRFWAAKRRLDKAVRSHLTIFAPTMTRSGGAWHG